MALSVLITQCLQRDFIEPVEAHEPLPNKLHVGHREALRLMGHDTETGAVAQIMHWARAQASETLEVVHLRDWHDAHDPRQHGHMATFGAHCIAGTPGAALVLGLDETLGGRTNERLINSIALNDFEDTDLGALMAQFQARAGGEPLRVGVIGVWTEAKVSFLLYDLMTRCHVEQLATCSALTASASRAQHFNALEQLRKILGVSVFDSVGEFAEWLVPASAGTAAVRVAEVFQPALTIDGLSEELGAEDRDVLGFLYRDSAHVTLKPLSGGFSGALVFKARSWDGFGHEQAPSVAKIGPRKLIGGERTAFERIEAILGNNAPSVRGFVDLGQRAGLKYSYAAMGRGEIRTFKSLYEEGLPQARVDAILNEVFGEILEPLYAAALYERLPALEHYGFSPQWADGVRRNVARVYGEGGEAELLRMPDGSELPSVTRFYTDYVPRHLGHTREYHYVAYTHGDLNGANILVDHRDNVWVIDFFHTGPGHVIKDLLKVENDLLYIFTPIETEDDLRQAYALTCALVAVADLAAPLPESVPGVTNAALCRAWATLRTLRALGGELVREDRNPLQALIGLLRYAVHTLTFDESSAIQKRWALAAACRMAQAITVATDENRDLRVAWLDLPGVPGRLGLTLCPGRRDHGRDLEADLAVLQGLGVRHIYGLLSDQELEWAGVAHIAQACAPRGIRYVQHPILDQSIPTLAEAHVLSTEINAALEAGEAVVIHCIGGLGRTGTLAACVALERGTPVEEAIRRVRRARGPRAIESPLQERFVREYAQGESAAAHSGASQSG